MVTYFAADTDQTAVANALTPPADDESFFDAAVAPDGEAFVFLVDLVFGEGAEDLDVAQQAVWVDANQGVMRIGAELRDTVADMDAGVLADLAGPWAASDVFAGVEADPVDFLTDFQHLCRHARAKTLGVYAVQVP